MDLRNYFAQAQDEANENFFAYDGNEEEFDFVDDEFDNFGGDDDDAFDMASGGRMSTPTSQPYIVTIKNTNATTAFPCTILGAYSTLAFTSLTIRIPQRFL